MRTWLTLGLLCSIGSALAQNGSLPNESTCAQLIAPETRTMSLELSAAIRATVQAYAGQNERFFNSLAGRAPTPDRNRELTSAFQAQAVYVGRLLAAYSWPIDMGIRAGLASIISEPKLQSCAGQLALKAATTLKEREQAATLIDQGLSSTGLGQRYGTAINIVGRKLTPLPIGDEANVDTRRAELGLPPLAEVLEQLQANLLGRAAPAGLKRPVKLNPVCEAFTTLTALNTPLTDAQLDELEGKANQLMQQDQASRNGGSGAREMRDVDAESTAWLKMVLKRFGWPSTNRADTQLSLNNHRLKPEG